MIYTVGKTKQYEKYLRAREMAGIDLYKGMGGSVWRTLESVKKYLSSISQHDYSIYGVEADWDKDAKAEHGHSWRSLKRKAKIIRLD